MLWSCPGTAAYASTTYTWDKANPEGDHRNWDTKENWSPAWIPGDGDSVVIADGGPDLGVPNGLHLQDLEVTGFGRLSGGSVTVDRLFQWSGGTIHTAVTVAFEGMVTAGDGKNRKQLGADLTVKGRLDLVAQRYDGQDPPAGDGTEPDRGDDVRHAQLDRQQQDQLHLVLREPCPSRQQRLADRPGRER